jgi:hypothetical protein
MLRAVRGGINYEHSLLHRHRLGHHRLGPPQRVFFAAQSLVHSSNPTEIRADVVGSGTRPVRGVNEQSPATRYGSSGAPRHAASKSTSTQAEGA